MSRRSGLKVAIALAGALACGQALAKDYIVKFKSNQSARNALHLNFVEGARVIDSHLKANLVKIDLGSSESLADEAKALLRLMARPDVEYVVEDFKLNLLDGHFDPDVSKQWSLEKIHANTAWSHGIGSRKVTVAVIDTGADYNHIDLKENMVKGYNFIEGNDDPQDITQSGGNPGHGTHCSGIIGALGVDGGTAGINQQVSIMPLRFIGPSGQGDLMAAIKAIDFAIEKKVDVVSASWGANVSEDQAQPLIEAIGRLNSAGIIFVAAAGNDGANNDSTSMYPVNAKFPNVIAVAASDDGDGKPSWSNYGRKKVALASPGLNILSTLPDNNYGNLSGTSMATPLVAGLVALLKSQNSANLTGAEVKALLQSTGEKTEIETACQCRIDAGAAADALASKKLVLVPAAETFAIGEKGKFSAIGGSGKYKFSSANPNILEVAADGSLNAKASGDAIIKVTDTKGVTSQSIAIHVEGGEGNGGDNGDGGKGGSDQCPFGPAICQIACTIQPTLPWCK